MPALLLAGHGSHITSNTSAIVWEQVKKIRQLGVFDEVSACFWKELPSFSRGLLPFEATDITIVPLFTAQGYFTRTVIPTEMGLDGVITYRDGRTIRYSQTLSEHPYLSQVVEKRVHETLKRYQLDPHNVTVAVIGHGTKRNADSKLATQAQADQIKHHGWVADAHAVFLDDTPSIPDIYDLAQTDTIVAIPFFLALGSHTTIDVPNALGLSDGQLFATIADKSVIYTDPIGLDAGLTTVILELATAAGATPAPITGDGYPKVGRDAFVSAMHKGGIAELNACLTPFLPLTGDDLFRAFEAQYPSAIAEWYLYKQGRLPLATLLSTLQRQTGIYRAVETLQDRKRVVERVCGTCERHPLWYDNQLPMDKIPCGEACNWWLSDALEVVNEQR